VVDPWKTRPVGVPKMEIPVYLGEKCPHTIWNEIPFEIEGQNYFNLKTRYGILQEPTR